MRKRLRSIAKAKFIAEGHSRIFRKSISGANKKKGTSFFSDSWRDIIKVSKRG